MLIPIEKKDQLLRLLVENCGRGLISVDTEELSNETGLDFDTLASLLEEFQMRGLIDDLNCRFSVTHFVLTPRARIMLESGGFAMAAERESLVYENLKLQKEALRLEYKALKEELESLKRTNPTLAERVASFIGSLASVAGIALT